MAEVIGVIASVGQLLHYSCTLIETLRTFYERVRDAPERHDRQLHHITQIINTATLIRETESLQNDLVSTHLNSITITVRSLEQNIKKALDVSPTTKKRYWKALWSSDKENTISKGFELLEGHKSALALCLLGTLGAVLVPAIHSTVDIVEQIRTAIQQLPRNQMSMQSTNEAHHSSLEAGGEGGVISCGRLEGNVAQLRRMYDDNRSPDDSGHYTLTADGDIEETQLSSGDNTTALTADSHNRQKERPKTARTSGNTGRDFSENEKGSFNSHSYGSGNHSSYVSMDRSDFGTSGGNSYNYHKYGDGNHSFYEAQNNNKFGTSGGDSYNFHTYRDDNIANYTRSKIDCHQYTQHNSHKPGRSQLNESGRGEEVKQGHQDDHDIQED